MSPIETRRCSLWQYRAALVGWNKANQVEPDEPPVMSGDDFDEMLKRNNL